MRKAIYLNALINVQSASSDGDLEKNVRSAFQKASSKSKVKFDIKRVRSNKAPARPGLNIGLFVRRAMGTDDAEEKNVSILVYGEGEQDAPQNFTELASAELRKLLETAAAAMESSGLKASVTTIEENTNAVDELADEADAGSQTLV
jgi:hypothetical protein